MDPLNLASSVNLAGGRGIGYFLYEFPIPILMVLVTLAIGFVILWRRSPSLLTGTAQVRSLNKSADHGGRALCRIELEVNIPDREPFVALIEQSLRPAEQAAAQPGATVAVRAVPENPKSVRLVLPDEAAPAPRGVKSRLQTILAYAAGIATLAVVVGSLVAGICAGHLWPF